MKKFFYLVWIPLFLNMAICTSCKDHYPNGCHKTVNIANNSAKPIYVIGAASRYTTGKLPMVSQNNAASFYVEEMSHAGCLEVDIEYFESRREHPHNFVIYLCDTTTLTNDTSSCIDPYYNKYRILKTVDLISVGLHKLSQSDFTITFP